MCSRRTSSPSSQSRAKERFASTTNSIASFKFSLASSNVAPRGVRARQFFNEPDVTFRHFTINRRQSYGHSRSPLTVSSTLRQIIIDHPAPILLCFRHRRIAAFFVTADLVRGIEAFKHEFACGHHLRFILAIEVEWSQRGVQQLGYRFKQYHALFGRRCVCQPQVVPFVEPTD